MEKKHKKVGAPTKAEIEAWSKLLEFVRSKCLGDTPEIDFTDFYQSGSREFDLKLLKPKK